jgi:uncharacterized protein HemX
MKKYNQYGLLSRNRKELREIIYKQSEEITKLEITIEQMYKQIEEIQVNQQEVKQNGN